MKKIVCIILLCLMFTATGCGKKVINCEFDELKKYAWSYSGEYGTECKLSFDNDTAMLTVTSGSESTVIKGVTVSNDNTIIILDENLKKEFVFTYTLGGVKVTL
ncbi:MAG: hypothetical protein K2M82_04110 [Lachnospiraceae bacterium]|nr:hypothetical protein [Lachnospiraceae bacterium]